MVPAAELGGMIVVACQLTWAAKTQAGIRFAEVADVGQGAMAPAAEDLGGGEARGDEDPAVVGGAGAKRDEGVVVVRQLARAAKTQAGPTGTW